MADAAAAAAAAAQQPPEQQQPAPAPAPGDASPLPPGSSAASVSTTATATTTATNPGYINKGLELWEQRRREWLSKGKENGGKGAAASSSSAPKRARSVDVDTIIESIFSTNGDARLPQPVPLSQMIDLLVDFWEADGLFD